MIDLKKLEVKFEAYFENETVESFNLWLEERKRKETNNVDYLNDDGKIENGNIVSVS